MPDYLDLAQCKHGFVGRVHRQAVVATPRGCGPPTPSAAASPSGVDRPSAVCHEPSCRVLLGGTNR